MIKFSIIIVFITTFLMMGCHGNTPSRNTVHGQSSLKRNTDQGISSLIVTTEGTKWHQVKNEQPFDEVISKFPFNVNQPKVPFKVIHKSAKIIDAPFAIIQLI